MALPQQRYENKDHSQYDINHLNILRHVSDIFSAGIAYATHLAEIRYSNCSDVEQRYLHEVYGNSYDAVITGLVRESAELVGIDIHEYRLVAVEPKKFADAPKRKSFYELIEQLQAE
jgi:hypothetical protein